MIVHIFCIFIIKISHLFLINSANITLFLFNGVQALFNGEREETSPKAI